METQIQPLSDSLPASLADIDISSKTPEQVAAEAKQVEDQKKAEEVKVAAEAAAKATADAKTEEEKKKAEEDAKATTEDSSEVVDPEAAKAYWDEVNKLHGIDDFTVDYGDTDPLSAEGAYLREKTLITRVQQDLEESLKQSDPRGYAYLLHRKAGGDDETFFNTPSVTLPDYEQFKTSVDLQKQVLVKDLQARGIDEDNINAIVDKAIKDKKLEEQADRAYKNREAMEQKNLQTAEANAKQRAEFEDRAIKSAVSAIDDLVLNGKTDKIIIPDAKRAEFAAALKENLFFDGEKFFLMKELTKDNLNDVVQAEYFGHVKGNLSDLVARKANTVVANKVRLGAKKSEAPPKSNSEEVARNKNFVPFGDI